MRTSIWLLPDERAAAPLEAAIDELADAFGAPRFVPHLTLVGEATAPGPALAATLESLSHRAPLVLAADSIEVTDACHRALFLRVRADPALLALREAALRSLASSGGEPFVPHVSLLYANRPAEEKRPWLARLAPRLPRAIRFDRLAAVVTTGPVERWRVRWEGTLAEPS